MNKLLLLMAAALLLMAGCGEPLKYANPKVGLCGRPTASLGGVPYARSDPNACAVAVRPFDVAVWTEAAYNSHKIRGRKTAELGCQPLTPSVDNCAYCGPTGHATSMMVNFDATLYQGDVVVRRAVLAVHSPSDAEGLRNVWLRGRLNVGDELQSLARNRGGMVRADRGGDGWVFFDVSHFVARAISERRNSIHFELSMPCQTPAANQVTVSVTQKEPQLIVEFN